MVGLPFRLLQIVSGIVLVPLAFRYLGEARFGLWAALTALGPLITLADFGLSQGLVTPLSQSISQDARTRAQEQVFGTLLLVMMVAFAFAGLLSVVTAGFPAPTWAHWFNIQDQSLVPDVKTGFCIIAMTALALMPLSLAARVRASFQESFATSAWDAVGVIAGLIGFIAVIAAEGSLGQLALALTVPPLFTNLCNWVGLIRRHRWLVDGLSPSRIAAMVGGVAPIIRLGLMFFCLTMAALITSAGDSFLALQLDTPEGAAKIALAAKLYGAGQALLYAALTPLWPAFADALTRADHRWIGKTLLRTVLITTSASFILAIAITLIANPALRLVIGGKTELPLSLLIANMASLILFSLINIYGMLLNGAGAIKIQIISSVLFTILAIILKLILPSFIGLSGIVWGTSISYLITTLPIYIYNSKKFYP